MQIITSYHVDTVYKKKGSRTGALSIYANASLKCYSDSVKTANIACAEGVCRIKASG